MKRLRKLLPIVVFYCSLIGVWQLLFSLELVPTYSFPSPAQVLARLMELAEDEMLWTSVRATGFRILLGYSCAALIGLLIGVMMGMSKTVNRCLKSLFLGLQTLPTAAWVPLSLLLFGLSDYGIYFVIVMSSFPAVAISTSDGIHRIPPLYLRVGQTFGIPAYQMPFLVILPAALPSIVTGIKLGFTLGWHGAVSAELIKSSIGLGFLLSMGRELADASQVIGVMILTILFGLMVDYFIFRTVERKVAKRWGLAR